MSSSVGVLYNMSVAGVRVVEFGTNYSSRGKYEYGVVQASRGVTDNVTASGTTSAQRSTVSIPIRKVH